VAGRESRKESGTGTGTGTGTARGIEIVIGTGNGNGNGRDRVRGTEIGTGTGTGTVSGTVRERGPPGRPSTGPDIRHPGPVPTAPLRHIHPSITLLGCSSLRQYDLAMHLQAPSPDLAAAYHTTMHNNLHIVLFYGVLSSYCVGHSEGYPIGRRIQQPAANNGQADGVLRTIGLLFYCPFAFSHNTALRLFWWADETDGRYLKGVFAASFFYLSLVFGLALPFSDYGTKRAKRMGERLGS
jgi:hypothetical protein